MHLFINYHCSVNTRMLVRVFLYIHVFYWAYSIKCPTSKNEWEERSSSSKICVGKEVYHCFKTTNNKTKEICSEPKFVEQNECPILETENPLVIITEKCQMEGCPNSSYTSNHLYKYPVCFGDTDLFETTESYVSTSPSGELTHEMTTIPLTKLTSHLMTKQIISSNAGNERYFIIIGGVLGFIALLNICVITLYCIRKRRRQKKSQSVNNTSTSLAVVSRVYDETNINPLNNASTSRSYRSEDANVYNLNDNEDIYNHLQSRRVNLDKPILYDSD